MDGYCTQYCDGCLSFGNMDEAGQQDSRPSGARVGQQKEWQESLCRHLQHVKLAGISSIAISCEARGRLGAQLLVESLLNLRRHRRCHCVLMLLRIWVVRASRCIHFHCRRAGPYGESGTSPGLPMLPNSRSTLGDVARNELGGGGGGVIIALAW